VSVNLSVDSIITSTVKKGHRIRGDINQLLTCRSSWLSPQLSQSTN